jgi:dihydropteroate synthase
LAGSAFVRFQAVMSFQGADAVPLHEVPAEVLTRLSLLRPPLCGLALDRPRIMGILNVTPDSFSDGGDLATVQAAVARAQAMPADILDIGGESTRPGAQAVGVADEIARVAPVIRALRDAGITTPISIDTRKTAVAEAALDAGADIVNDVSAFRYDPELADLVAERGVPVCLMHSKGDPATMQDAPRYDDVVAEVLDHLAERMEFAAERGIARDRMIVDPGIGFAKTQAHNLALLAHLSRLHDLGVAVLLGASRKKFIGTIGGAEMAKDRMPGSVAVALHGAAMGVQILRVHDVTDTAQALALWQAINAPVCAG